MNKKDKVSYQKGIEKSIMRTLNYIGAKQKLSSWIVKQIKQTVEVNGKQLADMRYCEPFAGTGIISRLMSPNVKHITANDLEYYSYILNSAHLLGREQFCPKRCQSLIDNLNQLTPISGKIHNDYCSHNNNSTNGRLYFKSKNGAKIDAIRQGIRFLFKDGEITINERFLLLTSLIIAADKVANCASVYGAYLKKLKRTAKADLFLNMPIISPSNSSSNVYWMNASQLIRMAGVDGDILYLDPPYNQRQYGANYHVLNTIALYDDFVPSGVTGLRPYNKSAWCSRRTVAQQLDELINGAKFRHVFMSYNDEGLMSLDEISGIMSRYGRYRFICTDYGRYKADSNRQYKRNNTTEYLHILDKF